MKSVAIRSFLIGGDRRSIGRANKLVTLLEGRPDLLPELVCEMWSADAVLAMRAADALEKFTRKQADVLQRFKKELLGLAKETCQQELRWHLAAMLPRLQLSSSERRQVIRILIEYLEDKSSIVKTFALQGLFDLSLLHSELRPQVEELLTAALSTGTAAMRARSRKLLSQIAKKHR
ncbi:MAG TPA: hypothetical protein VI685_07355 [Candidatus Angelobacter sp.]